MLKYKTIALESQTILVSRSTVFWDVTPYHPVEVHSQLGGTYSLHFDPHDRGSTFLQTFSELLLDYRALLPRRQYSS
jgi:hypothetical protein